MFAWLGKTFIIQFFWVVAVQAGPLELLSKGAFLASGNRCDSYDSNRAAEDLRKLQPGLCEDTRASSKPMGMPGSVDAVNELVNYMNSESEDQLFALLANQQRKELLCAADFSKTVSGAKQGDPLLQNISEKLDLARVAKEKLAEATQKLATDPNVSSRTCPLELGDDLATLKAEFPTELHASVTFKLCQEIITHRQAYNAIVGAIPLSGVPEVQKYIEEYVNSKTAPTRTLQSVYKAADKSLQTNSEKLKRTLAGQGAKSFKRTDRHQLLADPGLATQAFKSLPEASQANMQGLLCQADARYGKGADSLDTGVMALSLGVSGAVGLLGKSGMYVTRAAALAGEARSAGLVSLGSMRILQATALALDTGAAYAATDKACSGLLVSDIKTENACTSAPNAQKIEQEDCVLTASLNALGYASVIPPTALKFSRIKTRSNAFSKQSEVWKLRTLGKTAEADKLEAEVVNSLTKGKIVQSRLIGSGMSDPSFVRFEDGTEGIWKPNFLGGAKHEIAAYKFDKEIGADLIPITVPKRMNGVEGTVQVRVTSLRHKSKDNQPDELSLYDYLLANEDRHKKNYLQTAEGQPVAIDHGLSFNGNSAFGSGALLRFNDRVKKLKGLTDQRVQAENQIAALKNSLRAEDKVTVARLESEVNQLRRQESNTQQDLQAYVPNKAVIDKLRQTSEKRWKEALGGELTDQQISDLYGRQQTLLRDLDAAEALIGTERLYRAGPSSPVFREDLYF